MRTSHRRMKQEDLPSIKTQLHKLFDRIERCYELLDEAFEGQLFLRDLPPDCPANIRRFSLYLEEASALTTLFCHAIELWRICCNGESHANSFK